MAKVDANGISIEYEAIGDPTHPPMILIMGLLGQLVVWDDDFCHMLVAKGHYVIRFDNRDVGLSSRLDHLGSPRLWNPLLRSAFRLSPNVPYTLRDMAADVVGLMDALRLPTADLVGISMGGMIAQILALEVPSRVRSLCSLMSTTGERLLRPPDLDVAMHVMKPPPKEREERIRYGVEVLRKVSGPGLAFNAERARRIVARSAQRSTDQRGGRRQLAAILASPSRKKALSQLKVPTVVVHGTRDPILPIEAGRATARAIPDARLVVVEGMGHYLVEPAWQQVIDAVHANACREAKIRV